MKRASTAQGGWAGGGEKKRGGEGRGGGRGGDKSREDVKAIVDGGSEGRILNFGCKEPRWGGRLWWKEADELNNFAVRSSASNTVIVSNGFVKSGGDIQKPRATKL